MATKCKRMLGSKQGKNKNHHKSHKKSDKDIWGFNPDLGRMKGGELGLVGQVRK